jgi:ribonuclease D
MFQFRDISDEQIKQLPVIQFPGFIHVIDSPSQVKDAVNFLSRQQYLGFDTETRPSFKRGQSYKVSLIQLATENECYLFRLNLIDFPEELKQLLENPEVKKVGFDLGSDFHQLFKLSSFKPQGFIDLQKEVKALGIKQVSLRKLTAMVLGKRLSKRQRLSNWNLQQLTEAQKVYAATDAWVTLMLYKKLFLEQS